MRLDKLLFIRMESDMVAQSQKILLFIVLATLFYTGPAKAAGLKTLMEIGAGQAEIAKSLRQETESYDAVKKAVNSGAIKEGMAADTIREKYGGPIVETYDKKSDLTRWLYMPASSGHFKGEKLYIYIDSENKVKRCELILSPKPLF